MPAFPLVRVARPVYPLAYGGHVYVPACEGLAQRRHSHLAPRERIGPTSTRENILTAAQISEVPEGVGRLGNPSREPVTCPEGRKHLGHASRVLELHEVRRAGQDEPFGVWQPRKQQPVRLAEARPEGVAPLA